MQAARKYDWVDTEIRLRRAIETDHAEGRLVTSRADQISRTHYGAVVGMSKSYLGLQLAGVFSEYEERYKIETGPLALLGQMKVWLEQAYQDRTLEFLRGKLDRRLFEDRFNLKGGSYITRHAAICDLLTAYDERAAKEGYIDAARLTELEQVRRHLERDVPLNKDKLTVNRKQLWVECEVVKLRAHDAIVDDLIRSIEAQILSEARTSKINPYLHGRRWDFRIEDRKDLDRFLTRVGEEFKKAFGTKETSAKSPYLSWMQAIRWIAGSNNPDCAGVIAEAVSEGKILDERAWEEALYGFRASLEESVRSQTLAVTNANGFIKGVRAMTSALALAGIVPNMTRLLQSIKNHRSTQHLKSIAEASSDAPIENDYLEFVRTTLRPYRRPEALGVELEDETFLRGIAEEAGVVDLNDPSSAVLQVLRTRKAAIESAALAKVLAARAAFEIGRDLENRADIDVHQFVTTYLRGGLSPYEKSRFMREFFPHPTSPEAVARGQANLLKLIEVHLSGIFPASGARNHRGEWGQFFHHRLQEVGGAKTLQPMVAPTSDAVCAVLTLYLLESGANVEVGRFLLRHGIRPSDLADHVTVVGFKGRAGGKPIIADVRRDSAAGSALSWLMEAGAGVAAHSEDPECMFNARFGSDVQVVTAFTYTNWFKALVSATPAISKLRIVPNMLRPSVLLEAALSNDGRLMLGMAIGQHSLHVSQGYQQKSPVRLAYDANIRRFQNTLEGAILAGVPEAARRLGQTAEDVERRARDLVDSGLGTFCSGALGRPEEKRCSSMACWDDCPNMVIIAEAEPIAGLQIWRDSLRRVAGEWERDRPERWERVWLPWLCLVDVVEEQMARGQSLLVWREAEKLSHRVRSAAGFVPPEPW